MAIVQISKIIHRTGANVDLPQLDAGEFGYATDQQKLYIGDDSVAHPPVSESDTTQTEVLTEHSTLNFNKIGGVANTTLSLNNVQTGQLLVATGNAVSGNAWTNWDGTVIGPDDIKLQLGSASTIKIEGGTNQQFLQTDGLGNLTWTNSVGAVTIAGTPGGSNTQLQFNDAGDFGGSAYLTYNKVTHALTLDGEFNTTGNVSGNTVGTHFGPVGNSASRSSGEFTTLTTVSTTIIGGNVTAANVNTIGEVVAGGNVSGQNLVTAGEANVAILNVTGNVMSNIVPDTTNTYELGDFWYRWNNAYVSDSLVLGTRVVSTDYANIVVDGGIITTNADLGNVAVANYFTGTITTADQPNITSLGNLTSLRVTGQTNLGSNVANIKIGGGSAGFVLGTDGLANLRWVPNTELLRKPSGANTQIQYNNNGDFGADSGLVYDNTTNTLTTNTIQLAGVLRVIGNITTAQVNSNGSITGTVITANTRFVGNGANLSQLNGANVTGTVPLATSSTFAGTVTVGAQPNITSVGTLSALSVTGSLSAGSLSVVGALSTNKISTGSVLGNLIPDASGVQTLGTSTKRWKDLWLSGTSIYLGTLGIHDDGGALSTTGAKFSDNLVVGDTGVSTHIDVVQVTSALNKLYISTDLTGVSILSKANQEGSGFYIMDGTNQVSTLINDGTGIAVETTRTEQTGFMPGSADTFDLGAENNPWKKAVISTTKTKSLDLNLADDSGTFSMFANVDGIFVRNNMTDSVFAVNLTPVP